MRPNVLSARKSFIYIKYMKDQLILSAVLAPAFSQLKDLNPKMKNAGICCHYSTVLLVSACQRSSLIDKGTKPSHQRSGE